MQSVIDEVESSFLRYKLRRESRYMVARMSRVSRIMTYTVSILGTRLRYSRTITAINTLACVRVTINHSLSQQRLVAVNREVLVLPHAVIVNDASKNGESTSNVKNTAHSC